jgi:hypothetical protein
MAISLGSLALDAIHLGSSEVRKAYLGSDLVWNKGFVDEPKIDPAHALANRTTMTMLVNGDPTGTTLTSGTSQVVDSAYASTVAGTMVMRTKALPASNDRTLRVSAIIKVDKTAGRYSRVGIAIGALTSSADAYIGYNAGTGFQIASVNFATFGTPTILAEAKCVDGAWYRVSLVWDNITTKDTTDTGTGKARLSAAVEPVDVLNNPAVPWYPDVSGARLDSVGAGGRVPITHVYARTNSALGTIKDVYYIDTALGATSNGTDPVDNAPLTMQGRMGDGTSSTDLYYLYSKGKAAPLRVIITSGGSGVFGGIGGFAHANGRTGHPYDAFRKFWRDLADLGYTVLHTEAEHEGWGNDSHLAKQLEALTTIQNEWGVDARIYYLGYSMGGSSMWRAIMGRNGFPSIRAAYGIAPISNIDMYWGHASFPQCDDKWPVRAEIDDPYEFDAATLVARNTRIRLVTSDADTNVDKATHHDPMVAKFASEPDLISELVYTGIGHFDPEYWDAQDCVDFFEGADA